MERYQLTTSDWGRGVVPGEEGHPVFRTRVAETIDVLRERHREDLALVACHGVLEAARQLQSCWNRQGGTAMSVGAYCQRNPRTGSREESVRDAAVRMQQENVGALVSGGPTGQQYRVAQDPVFVSRQRSAQPGNEYDDLLHWLPAPNLYRALVDAGYLP